MKIGHSTIRTILLILCSSSISFAQYEVYRDSLRYFRGKGDTKNALIYYDKILSLYPNSTDYLLEKGAFLASKERNEEAIRLFSKVIAINPRIKDAYVRRGFAYGQLQKYDSSILDYTRAIGKYSFQDSVAYTYRAFAYLNTRQYELAKSDCDSALKFNPRDKLLLHGRADAKLHLNDLKGSLEDLNRAIAEDNNYLDGIQDRANVNLQLGNLDNALRDARHHLKYYPLNERSNYIAGAALFFKKDYKTALQYVDKCKTKATIKEVYKLSGLCHYYLVHDQLAIEDLTKYLTLNVTQAEEAEAYYTIGICKNNVEPRSGCKELALAIDKGFTEGQLNYDDECK